MTDALSLDQLNGLQAEDARNLLLRCCGSTEWARRMVERRPFHTLVELESAADEVWRNLDGADWLEAFAAHPRIGEREVPAAAAATSGWAVQEQSGAREATSETLARLAAANREYEDRFGYRFIVCATGKSAAEILVMLEQRLPNSADVELAVAAEEQRKITQLRLNKLLNADDIGGAGHG
jgi:OHCU decarboxylase